MNITWMLLDRGSWYKMQRVYQFILRTGRNNSVQFFLGHFRRSISFHNRPQLTSCLHENIEQQLNQRGFLKNKHFLNQVSNISSKTPVQNLYSNLKWIENIRYCHSVTKNLESTAVTAVDECEDLQTFARRIVSEASQKDVMAQSVPVSSIMKQIETFCLLGFTRDQIQNVFITNPELLRKPNLHVIVKHLSEYGFTQHHIAEIISKVTNNEILTINKITEVMNTMREFGYNEKSILKALSSHPNIFNMNSQAVLSRVEALKKWFKTSDIISLTKRYPNILFEDMEVLQEKFDYVYHRMGVSQAQMKHAELFSFPLEHIQARHIYLERAGFFMKPKHRHGEKNANPLLQDILNSPDAVFARRFGGLSIEEYRTFYNLFLQEKEHGLFDDEEVEEIENETED
ncbi:hypothetical protein CHS0354_008597 [Potamilus streckersoni]|uniref:Uncharacterized protein n=1 Tax=Potamilus streckersoni TaxID=2493646 RepID=A0AAE0SWB4_9BIVA|nr:hypothetical protein CHS0354_008597 [Potamilus streckersoni]